jgi:hypothetical protein
MDNRYISPPDVHKKEGWELEIYACDWTRRGVI